MATQLDKRLRIRLSALDKDDGQGYYDEYDQVLRADVPKSTAQAATKENSRRNRYRDVLPNDDNRILLASGGYINASLLLSAPGEDPEWTYLASQGPLDETTGDFWTMIYEQRCEAIVMLTRTTENRRVKCAEYFPTRIEEKQVHGGYEVTLVGHSTLGAHRHVEVRTFTIRPCKDGESRSIQHYLYSDWPDHGAPASSGSIRAIMDALNATRASGSAPAVIHCSAGIGRTGAFCTIDIMLRRIRHWLQAGQPMSEAQCDSLLDLGQVVRHLRSQRLGMVQTVEQYHFCYLALHEALTDICAG